MGKKWTHMWEIARGKHAHEQPSSTRLATFLALKRGNETIDGSKRGRFFDGGRENLIEDSKNVRKKKKKTGQRPSFSPLFSKCQTRATEGWQHKKRAATSNEFLSGKLLGRAWLTHQQIERCLPRAYTLKRNSKLPTKWEFRVSRI